MVLCKLSKQILWTTVAYFPILSNSSIIVPRTVCSCVNKPHKQDKGLYQWTTYIVCLANLIVDLYKYNAFRTLYEVHTKILKTLPKTG
jgi:hypothetical protein